MPKTTVIIKVEQRGFIVTLSENVEYELSETPEQVRNQLVERLGVNSEEVNVHAIDSTDEFYKELRERIEYETSTLYQRMSMFLIVNTLFAVPTVMLLVQESSLRYASLVVIFLAIIVSAFWWKVGSDCKHAMTKLSKMMSSKDAPQGLLQLNPERFPIEEAVRLGTCPEKKRRPTDILCRWLPLVILIAWGVVALMVIVAMILAYC